MDIEKAAAIIRSGGLVAFPTETVYGLGANALDAGAVARIFEVKGRPATSPLIVHVSSTGMARSLADGWSADAEALAARFWPGPLTLVLRKASCIPGNVTAGMPTVGIRMPAHLVALELIATAGLPIAAPSANRFTQLSPTEARHVRDALGDRVDLILDGGPTTVGIESTVVSLDGLTPVLLRPGMITKACIESVIGPIAGSQPLTEGGHASPGLHPKHYSPATKLLLTGQPPPGRGAYLWWRHWQPAEMTVRMSAEAAAYARELYTVLHKLDAEKLDFIAMEPVPDSEEWSGIRDRLTRAARQE